MADQKKELLRVENLKKYFNTPGGVLHAVDDITFSINKGETLGVVGESGCGKSTMGRTILRLHEHTAGEVYFEGNNIFKYSKNQMKQLRKEMQIVFQDPFASLNPRATVSEAIAEPLLVQKMFRRGEKEQLTQRVNELMDLVGLSKRLTNSYPHELDGGRRQRIGIARALALRPKFIVCDEPVSALDVSIQAQILNLMMDLQDQMGLTYMFITHDLSVVKHISNEIAVLYLGECVELAGKEDLFNNPLHPYTQALLAAIPVPNLSSRHKERKIIQGEVTSPISPKPGCRFASRCPLATKECTGEHIPLREVSPGHFVACCHV